MAALIIKYFQERKQNLFSKCNVHDELVFLGLFTTLTLNYVEWLNDTFNKEKNISNVFLPEIEFMPQIEEYYSNNKSIKPKFAINDLIMRAIDVNFEHISNIEMSHLLLLLNLSAENHKSIEDRYYIPSNKLVLRSYVKDRNCEYALVIKKSKKKCYEICANYFKTHADLSYIVIIYFEGNRAKISTVKRNNQNLKKIYK